MALFSKKKTEDATPAQPTSTPRDPRKARAWFDRAKTVADTRNYEYAIQSYISGLRFEPDNMDAHEALRDVSLKYKVNGGKPAGMMEAMKSGGKEPLDKMLNAEMLWAKDPTNPAHALKVMEEATAAELNEVAYWIGQFVVEANRSSKRPNKAVYLKVKDLYRNMEAFDKAAEACALAVNMDSNNGELVRELHNLQAETTLMKGGYGEENGDFKKGIKDAAKQKALNQDDAIASSADQLDEQIARLKTEYEDAPDDFQRLGKLIRALLQKEDSASEEVGIRLLTDAFERSGQYRFKMQVGDIRMRQFNRALREIRNQLKAKPGDAALKDQLRKTATTQVRYELEEFTERVKNYPTDMGLKYQLGRRQLVLGHHDEAIASFQEAQADPKHRAAALRYLGEAFNAKGWFDEAIDTYRRGMESHERQDDTLALELRYDLMDALESKSRHDKNTELATEASRIGSQIAQVDINFKDIRARIDKLRKLLDELRKA
ncbi:MAG: tetratricopeptide repeat protein [Phycisphaerales bacterium]